LGVPTCDLSEPRIEHDSLQLMADMIEVLVHPSLCFHLS